MAEYIEREALVHRLKSPYLFNITQRIFDIISEIPAADVAPVVRCKDCKHRIYKNMGDEIGEIGGCGLFNCAMPNEGFCSHGERKDGGNG